MKIYDKKLFKKYNNFPVRVKLMGDNYVAIAEGALLATFENLKQLRIYFPCGKYKLIS